MWINVILFFSNAQISVTYAGVNLFVHNRC